MKNDLCCVDNQGQSLLRALAHFHHCFAQMFDLKRSDNLNISLYDHTYFRQYFHMLYQAA